MTSALAPIRQASGTLELPEPVGKQFLDRTIPEPNSGCLLWTGSEHPQGYGRFVVAGRTWLAHRLAWVLAHGVEPQLDVLHRCDTPACVNVDHLFLGTHRDNMRDAAGKGRAWNPTARAKKAQTHCKAGHEFTATNTYTRANRTRQCRRCNAEHAARGRAS